MLSPEDFARELLLAGMEARAMVRGGLLGYDHASIDAEAQWLMSPTVRFQLDLEAHEVARVSAAMITGYAITHPTATASEREYEREVALEWRTRRVERATHELLWARHRAVQLAEHLREVNDKAHDLASVAFAHPVQNPVENDTDVIPTVDFGWTPERYAAASEHLQQHIARGELACWCVGGDTL
jgi:hypothetical protein